MPPSSHRWLEYDYTLDQYVRAALRLGVDGYLLKDAPQDALVGALREISRGGAVLPSAIASKVLRSYASRELDVPARNVWELTPREIEVIELLHQGLKNAEVAERLKISVRTVENHVSNILAKLGVQTRTEAIRRAVDRGFIR